MNHFKSRLVSARGRSLFPKNCQKLPKIIENLKKNLKLPKIIESFQKLT